MLRQERDGRHNGFMGSEFKAHFHTFFFILHDEAGGIARRTYLPHFHTHQIPSRGAPSLLREIALNTSHSRSSKSYSALPPLPRSNVARALHN